MNRFDKFSGTGLGIAHGDFPSEVNDRLSLVRPGPQTRYVSMWPGPPDADGSMDAPFNPNSVARAKARDEIGPEHDAPQQALNDVGSPANLLEWETPIRVIMDGGQYPEQTIEIEGQGNVHLVTLGWVRLGSFLTFGSRIRVQAQTPPVGYTNTTNLEVYSAGGSPGGTMLFFGDFEFGDGGLGVHYAVSLRDMLCRHGVVPARYDGELRFSLLRTEFAGLFNFYDQGRVYQLRDCNFSSNCEFREAIANARGCHFRSGMRIKQAPSLSGPYGFYGCQVNGTHDGPVGTALYDKTTQNQSTVAFTGGAGPADYLE